MRPFRCVVALAPMFFRGVSEAFSGAATPVQFPFEGVGETRPEPLDSRLRESSRDSALSEGH